MGLAVALISAFMLLSAMTALRTGRRGLFAALAYPVGWAAGELAGQAIVVEVALFAFLHWWGWTNEWLGDVVDVLVVVVVLVNLIIVGVTFFSRVVVRRAMRSAPLSPLEIPFPRDDRFGTWWRTWLQIPVHPRHMQLIRNVAYGQGERHRLDVWRLSTTPQPAPVILYLHGGAWTFGDKREQGRPMLHEFVARGWIVVTSNYRLAPVDPWPAQIDDAVAALAWIKTRIDTLGGDPDRVVVAGGSAGGHLASLLALRVSGPEWRSSNERAGDLSVRGAISLYGVLEMTGDEQYWRGLGRGLRLLLERRVVQVPYEGHEELYESFSPYHQIHEHAPPFLVIQGVNDTLVDVEVARSFVAHYQEVAANPIYYVELPFTQHAYDVTASPRTSATTRAAVAFAESVVSDVPDKTSRAN